MIHSQGLSALVRLSDAIKSGLLLGASMTTPIIAAYKQNEPKYNEIARLGKLLGEPGADVAKIESKLTSVNESIPQETKAMAAEMLFHLHGQAMSVILLSCFCLESYINNMAFFLFKEKDYLGLIKDGHASTADILVDAIIKMSVRQKWEKVCCLDNEAAFDRSRPPVQDFGYLFNFRDDVVHDKVLAFGEDRAKKRYNNRLPDPVLSQLSLKHAQYAARVYRDMVKYLHQFVGVEQCDFQKHYNLSPWRSPEDEKRIDALVLEYSKCGLDFTLSSLG